MPAPDDVARLLAGTSRLQALHDEVEADVVEAEPEPEDNRELRRRIMTIPAVTMAGVMVKARVAGWCWRGTAEMLDEVQADAARDNLAGEQVAFSAVADLVAMLERAA